MSLVSAFETRVNVNIVEGLVKLGYYEKEGLSLALGTKSWNVVIISPHSAIQESQSSSALKKRLAINRDITAIETANFGDGIDIVLIGTTTNLLAYDVESNSDIFYKDIPDGVNTLLFVRELPHLCNGKKQPIIVVGGNCSVQAFDKEGEEVYWTVTSDNVTCMVLCDIDNDGTKELLIGSEDCTIKAFKGEQVIYSISESDIVSHLQALGNNLYAYGLKNGTIGVYAGSEKLWKIDNKETVTSMCTFNISDNKLKPLICLIVGWSNGLVEARKIQSGKVLWSNLVIDSNDSDEKVAGIVVGNLRGNIYDKSANYQMITVSTKGVISAWIPKAKTPPKRQSTLDIEKSKNTSFMTANPFSSLIGGSGGSNDKNKDEKKENEMASIQDLDELETLINRRDELKEELEYLRANYKTLKAGNMNDPSLIPPNTEISCTLTPSIEKKSLLLIMNTNNSTVIKSAVIYGDKVFENGSFMLVPSQPKSSITLPLKFEKDLQCTLSIKAIVGHLSSEQNHVFELSHKIPKFASYLYVPTNSIPKAMKPTSFSTFVLPERVNRLILWLNQAFLLEYEANTKQTIDISFVSLRNSQYITLQCDSKNNIKISTQNLTLCGDIIQDIAQYLSIEELPSVCSFGEEFKRLRDNLVNVEQFSEIRNKLSVDIAANTAVIKNLIVKAEDSRVQKNYKIFKKQYSDLYDVNQEMIGEYNKRQNNHKNLIGSLKAINQTIQQMSRLRVGKYQKMTVTQARQAVKKKNVDSLINTLHSVSSPK